MNNSEIKKVNKAIGKAIKEGKWLYINYAKPEGDTTNFWICIYDINEKSKTFLVESFNHHYIDNEYEGFYKKYRLDYTRITRAEVIEGTTYDVPEKLLNKLLNNQISWLNINTYDEKILSYYKECVFFDVPPYQKKSALIERLDEEVLEENKRGFELSLQQRADLSRILEKEALEERDDNYYSTKELVVNVLSIKTKQGLFVIAYRNVLFDIKKKSLKLSSNVQYNYMFTIATEGDNFITHNLRSYLDMETDEFIELFEKDREAAKDLFMNGVLSPGEALDDHPYLMDMYRSFNVNINREFDSIREAYKDRALSAPLDAFFGNMATRRLGKRDDYAIAFLHDKLNIDQIRVIHNALKNPITYVQGPPGTGKTESIRNLIVSLLFNDQTVLVASNNNKPIDDLWHKLNTLKYNDRRIPMPILRLGNNKAIATTIQWIRRIIVEYADDIERADEEKISRQKQRNNDNYKLMNTKISEYEERLELQEQISALEKVSEKLGDNPRFVNLAIELSEKKKRLENLPIINEEEINKFITFDSRAFMMWLYFESLARLKRLSEPKYKEFHEILNMKGGEKQISAFNKFVAVDENLRMLQNVFPIMMTTNLSAPRLGSPKQHFDMVIIDEAGQCSIVNALFPIIRGRKLVLVGDQNQLQPVLMINPQINERLMQKYNISESYSYLDSSILKTMTSVDLISKFILLRYHYRSDPKIIDFSNQKYYRKSLKIKTKAKEDSLLFIDVKQGKHIKPPVRNTAANEVITIIEHIKQNNEKSVGIITPFRNQAVFIEEQLRANGISEKEVTVGTVHTYQGDERDIIYLSGAVTPFTSPKTYEWLKENRELVNVANTRARKKIVFVGDYEEIKEMSNGKGDFFELAEYIKTNGVSKISDSSDKMPVNSLNYQQFNTQKEQELLNALAFILSFAEEYIVREQVRVDKFVNRYLAGNLFRYAKDATYDFVIFRKTKIGEFPALVIELDGPEHETDEAVKQRDSKKELITKEHGIKLIRIKNDYSRRYVFVRDTILKALKN
jgi:hypothetical protein